MRDSTLREPRIAIVGAGPSGCFTAGALRRLLPHAQITVMDRLPCPFGLIRYGVAADHQSTKNITRQFDRIFTKEKVEFIGNVYVTSDGRGESLALGELAERVDVIVLATGLSADKKLEIPGSTLKGVYGSGLVTRIFNSHPEAPSADRVFKELGRHVAIVGMGNVAIDILRLLSKEAEQFMGSDINDDALERYHVSPVSKVDVFSRSPIEQVKCDAQMVRELIDIPGLRVTLGNSGMLDPESISDRTERSRVTALYELENSTKDTQHPRIDVQMHFETTPRQILGGTRVSSIVVENKAMEQRTYPVDSVISAIGFEEDEHSIQIQGRAMGKQQARIYRVGWCHKGPRGTIPDSRADAKAVATQIVQDLQLGGGQLEGIQNQKSEIPTYVKSQAVSYEQWLNIDRYEREHARPDRVRKKIPTIEKMLSISREKSRTQ